jgi:hypothetical protein
MPPLSPQERSRAESLAVRIVTTSGRDGLTELRDLFPGSVFLWGRAFGLTIIWNPADGQWPEGLFRSAGYLEVFGENGPRKDRTGSGRSLARERYPELSVVVDVMLS